MRYLSRLQGLRKFFVHLPSRFASNQTENISITCKTWYNFCELRKFSVLPSTMSIENSMVSPSGDSEIKTMNGLNGVSNGHSAVSADNSQVKEKTKSSSSSSHHHKSSKDKHRDKDRDHKSSKSSHSSSNKDKHHSSSSSGKDKHRDKDRHSSHKSKDKDKDKDKHREHKNHSSSNGDGHLKEKKSSSHDKDRSKDHKSSSSSKHHSSSSASKHHSNSSSSKHHSNSGSSKHHSNSGSSKHHSSSSTHRSRDKDKERHHSSKSSSNQNKHKENKVATDNGNQSVGPINNDITVIKEEHDPLDTSNFSYGENNTLQANGIRNCYVNVSQLSQASSCDYSMSQFRPDETSFEIKGDLKVDMEEASSEEVDVTNNDQNAFVHDDDDDDVPIASRKKVKRELSDDEDEAPLTARKKPKAEKKPKKIKREASEDEEDDYDKPKKKKIKKEKTQNAKAQVKTETTSPEKKGRKKKENEEQEVWKWWEEEKLEDGTKWRFLEHKGPVFAPDYDPLPPHVVFSYDGHPMKLSQDAEEVAGFYARMLDHDYTSKDVFNNNFFKDWRKSMTSKEREKITRLEKCNFKKMHTYFMELSEKNKNRTKEEKLALKEENEKMLSEYGFCTIDGHKEKIGNFKIEPPGLFRGRGEHPKMGLVKRRVMPEDVMINCSKDSKIPVPPKGHRWKEVRHDNTVTWLASWTENVQGQVKYVMLNPSSKLKGEKDWQKYETARRLHKHIEKIRSTYREEWKSKEMRIRQRAVALYFIDKLALRAGNEKDEDQADTVGCCSLRVEHIELHRELNGKENVVVFDFLGKDSIRYYNEIDVEKRVFKNLELFKENKKDGDDLFDRLNTVVMNEHLRDLMDGLTAKVFRTYNASWTLQNQLKEMTDPNASIPEKLLAYNRANRAVAILCNHQRAVPKGHAKSMENLKEKIRTKREQIDDLEVDVKDCIKAAKRGSVKEKVIADKKKKQLEKLKEQLKKLELQETDRDENKTIALGTSKLNYLDPRISVAWCKKHGVPIEKIYNKTQRDKFRWAIDMADEDYEF